MEWTQFLIMLVTIAGLFLWNRSDSKSDNNQMQAKLDQMQARTDAILERMQARTDAILDGIHSEMKDFHGRLCAIEEKNRRS